ncbi:uncharacterized protein YALI1_B04579g [Yarrowia lipolytica]|uniref:Uncharacterized protein n=1 Tax=Yarrowia lipolytica TaxID=4952 RepID=A0A1D8N6A1_YARLL|nr:hypothetical protein YALI1_B04579g [Yarrowia lipolytica]
MSITDICRSLQIDFLCTTVGSWSGEKRLSMDQCSVLIDNCFCWGNVLKGLGHWSESGLQLHCASRCSKTDFESSTPPNLT